MKVSKETDSTAGIWFVGSDSVNFVGTNMPRVWTPMNYTPLGWLYTEGMMIAL